ncbi:LptF/LptG family permease [Caulobacter henricii]|uniref:Permease n=1 Tax=Caulobacter henricii TaxID=69395 RepID=A0A0N7JI55_9CAUL|nr:LptF/LptG family permease [Caulobacter henricii]ALL15250.1 permease [Caulobacter henricii]
MLKLVAWPMVGCLGVTVVALLLERILRLLDALSQSSARFGYVTELAANLVPHYLGLALPVAFFVALFIVITKLSDDSEIDALLASGQSLSRIVIPFVCVGLVLSLFSVALFGYSQPYSRYAYRSVMHEAVNAGWNGRLSGGAFIDEDNLLMTADDADPAGQSLTRVFIRRLDDKGREEVITAETATLSASPTGDKVTLLLRRGQRIGQDAAGAYRTLAFDQFATELPLAGAATLLRARGGDERELTLNELARQAASNTSVLPKETLLAELYGRLARAAFLPFLPLLAFPLGLAAKRGNRTPGLIVAGLLLLAFQHSLQLGQSLAEGGKANPILAIWGPFLLFTGFSVWMFVGSLKRPGDTPISRVVRRIGQTLDQVRRLVTPRRKAAS